jgi:hypothetical protein
MDHDGVWKKLEDRNKKEYGTRWSMENRIMREDGTRWRMEEDR